MSITAGLFSAPTGFPAMPSYTAEWRAVRFELSPGTGEWITSHIALKDSEGTTVRQVIRPEMLRALFGGNSKHFQSLLDIVEKSLTGYLESGGVLANWKEPIEGFAATAAKVAYARHGRTQALRMAARQSTALCSLEDLELPADQPSVTSEEQDSGIWGDRIKDAVTVLRPDLSTCFDKSGMLYAESVRFGFLTDTSAAHFANLTPYSLAQSMRLARGKLQELRIGARTMSLTLTKLVAGAPRPDDITLSERQIANALRAVNELSQEADESNISLVTAYTVSEAADAVIALA
jgi:hypothetical protein